MNSVELLLQEYDKILSLFWFAHLDFLPTEEKAMAYPLNLCVFEHFVLESAVEKLSTLLRIFLE